MPIYTIFSIYQVYRNPQVFLPPLSCSLKNQQICDATWNAQAFKGANYARAK